METEELRNLSIAVLTGGVSGGDRSVSVIRILTNVLQVRRRPATLWFGDLDLITRIAALLLHTLDDLLATEVDLAIEPAPDALPLEIGSMVRTARRRGAFVNNQLQRGLRKIPLSQ